MKPLCVDLFCGLGGWAAGFVAEGYRIVGFDIDPRFAGPYREAGGEFVCQDVRTLDGRRFRNARCVVASPPCTEYSAARWVFNPELRRPPNRVLWDAAEELGKKASVPTVIENVQGAQRWRGKAKARFGPFYLWGDVSLTPHWRGTKGWHTDHHGRMQPNRRADIAKIPLPLARAVARGFL